MLTTADGLYTLGPERKVLLGDVHLRVNDDLKKCVAFVGYVTSDDDGNRQFHAGGTGYFQEYGGVVYFVTARHVAETLVSPFALRATSLDGDPVLREEMYVSAWHFHPDRNVDLAIVVGAPHGVPSLSQNSILTPDLSREKDIGIGDETYIIGLYRLMKGKKKNLPIVHSGNIAMIPGDELIPQRDSRTGEVKYVEGYLVESQTLAGLSGSPVFVRHTWQWTPKEETALLLGSLYLLGVWSGAWDAPPGEVLSLERPDAQRVPVGMGITVPSYKLLELFEMPKVVDHRKQIIEREGAANADSALPAAQVSEPPTTAENPDHREDFSRLVDAAVSGNKQGSETS